MDSDSSLLDSDPDARCPDSHITSTNNILGLSINLTSSVFCLEYTLFFVSIHSHVFRYQEKSYLHQILANTLPILPQNKSPSPQGKVIDIVYLDSVCCLFKVAC